MSIPSLHVEKLIFDDKWYSTFYTQIGEVANGKVAINCIHCKKGPRFADKRASSNLIRHLRECHSSEFQNFQKNNELFLTKRRRTVSNEGEKIPTFFPCTSQLSSTRVNMIDRALTKMIIIDNEALRLVERLGFQQYTAALNPSYKIPDRRTLSQHLSEIELEVKATIKKSLGNADSLSLCVDMWSSRRLKSYLGVTVFWHVADESFNATLTCNYFSGRHTSIRIAQSLIAEINSWGINENKITAFVSDNGSDMVKCFESVIPSIYGEELDQ